MNDGDREAKNNQKGKGKLTEASSQNQSADSWILSPWEAPNIEKVIRENEDMAGRYVSKIFCGQRIIGLVLEYEKGTQQFKIVYEDRNQEAIGKETLLRSLAPPDLVDQLFRSHKMPRLLCFLQQKVMDREVEAGRLKFLSITNDGVDKHLIWLIELKNLISWQLPHVPRENIVRLVLDTNYRSVMVIRRNQVVGGITYRPHLSQRLAEIAFCVIIADDRIKGYGARLMNHLKQHVRDMDGVTHLLTCADYSVVDSFTKQGFTKEITLEKNQWQGYIKEDDGGILMECEICPKFPYSYFSNLIRLQRQAINERINEVSSQEIVYPGIDFEKGDAGIPLRSIKAQDIPGLKEAGWTPDQYGHSRFERSYTSGACAPVSDQGAPLRVFMRALLEHVYEHPDSWPFKEPVDPKDAPGYYEIIKDPIDLETISKRVESGQYYTTMEMFLADVRRMFANARKYNLPHTVYYKCATRLEAFFSAKFQSRIR